MFVLFSFDNTEVEGRGTSKRAYLCVLRSLGAYSILRKGVVGLVFPGLSVISGYVGYIEYNRC